MKLFTLLALLVSFLSGCASNPRIEDLSSTQRSKLSEIKAYDNAPNTKYRTIGEVSGLSCNRNKYQAQNVTTQEAIEGVKINTVLMNADAAINVICQKNSDVDWTNNCWASVKCIGDAIIFEQSNGDK